MCAIPQLVSAPLNPLPIAEHFKTARAIMGLKFETSVSARAHAQLSNLLDTTTLEGTK